MERSDDRLNFLSTRKMLLIHFDSGGKMCQFLMLGIKKRIDGKAKRKGANKGCSKKQHFFLCFIVVIREVRSFGKYSEPDQCKHS